MKEYQQLRGSLLEMLEDLDDRLAKISLDVQEPLDKNSEEQAILAKNNDVLDGLGNAARSEIEKVKLAITRLDKGQYGLCQACGKPISKVRLKAVPYCSLCIKCATGAVS